MSSFDEKRGRQNHDLKTNRKRVLPVIDIFAVAWWKSGVPVLLGKVFKNIHTEKLCVIHYLQADLIWWLTVLLLYHSIEYSPCILHIIQHWFSPLLWHSKQYDWYHFSPDKAGVSQPHHRLLLLAENAVFLEDWLWPYYEKLWWYPYKLFMRPAKGIRACTLDMACS